MIDQAALDEVFPNNPLRQVSYEVRFRMNLRVLRDVYEVQQHLGSSFTEFGREEIQAPAVATTTNYVFSDLERGRVVKVGEDRLAVTYNKYEDYEQFSADALGVTGWFCGEFGIDRLTRLGLRYVNNLPVPAETGGGALFEYVRPHLDPERLEGAELRQFAMEVLTERDGVLLNSRSAFIIQQPSAGGNYVLDMDAFVAGEIAPGGLRELLDRLHLRVQTEFLGHVTEVYKRQMRSGK